MQENQFQRFENLLEEFKQYIERVQGELKKFNVDSTEVDVLEFEGKQYRRVYRKAQPGDVVVFPKSKWSFITSSEPYLTPDGTHIIDDTDGLAYIYGYSKGYDDVDSVLVYELIQETKSPNQLRKEIIEKAKSIVLGFEKGHPYVFWDIYEDERLIFMIVQNKRGLVKKVLKTKCHPNDVFNKWIGKAILVRRFYGQDASEFENAVQPTIAIGQMVVSDIGVEYKVCSLENVVGNVKFRDSKGNLQDAIGGYLPDEKWYKIIDDTNAIYDEVN